MSREWSFRPIGWVESSYKEKFGIPRQPGLARSVEAVLRLDARQPFLAQALKRLEEFSHLWVIYVFHEHGARDWKPSVRPPRLGGSKKVGVLASRSPHRPNPIGLSAVEIARIDLDDPAGPAIVVRGGDFLDGTPILDIKPYLPYADSIPKASSGWAAGPMDRVPVRFEVEVPAELRAMITEVLELDPRPAFQKRRFPALDPKSQGLEFGFDFLEHDVKWKIEDGAFVVRELAVKRSRKKT